MSHGGGRTVIWRCVLSVGTFECGVALDSKCFVTEPAFAGDWAFLIHDANRVQDLMCHGAEIVSTIF